MKQIFEIYKLKDLAKLGVECNLIGIERYFHNPKGRLIMMDMYDSHSMGGGIGFTVSTSNPKNDALIDIVFVKERQWTRMCKPNCGLSYRGDLDDYKKIAKFIADTCSLPDMILRED